MEPVEQDEPKIDSALKGLSTDRELSTAGTICAAFVIFVAAVLGIWLSWSSPRLDSVAKPHAALSLIVGRLMELREAVSEGAAWERRVYSTLLVSTPREVLQSIAWYEELVASSPDAVSNLELAILEAESGLTQKVTDRVSTWNQLRGNFPAFADLIEIAYLKPPDFRHRTKEIDLSILDQLQTVWFRDRLIGRLSTVLPNIPSVDEDLNSNNLLWSVRVFAGMTLLLVVTSFLSIPWVVRGVKSDSMEVAIGKATIPPTWRSRTALGIILRSAAVFLLVGIGLGILIDVLKVGAPLVLLSVYLIGMAVLCNLSRKYLLNRHDGNLAETYGVSIIPGKWGELVPWVALLAGAGIVGDLGILWIADLLGVSVHWTEWFDEDLVWGNYLDLGLLLFAMVVVGPIFEELLFRGLIFATLRQYFSFGAAAVSSAALFSLVHGYGVPGFFALLWTGLLWAWSVEKTKSLLPAIIGHGLHNLLMAVSLIIFLRA